MSERKKFHIGDLLSVSTGALVSPEHIGGVYKILNHMTGDNLMTHQLPLACDAMLPDLLLQHPWLKPITPPVFVAGEAEVHAWVASIADEHGEFHEVMPAPLAWGQHDPLGDLYNMKPDAKVVVVAVPDTQTED